MEVTSKIEAYMTKYYGPNWRNENWLEHEIFMHDGRKNWIRRHTFGPNEVDWWGNSCYHHGDWGTKQCKCVGCVVGLESIKEFREAFGL